MKRSAYRITKKWQYQQIYQANRKLSLDHITIFIKESDKTQFGITVTKKIGKAVVRNKLKRQITEIFFILKDNISGKLNIIFMPKKNITGLNFKEILDEIRKGISLIDSQNSVENCCNSD